MPSQKTRKICDADILGHYDESKEIEVNDKNKALFVAESDLIVTCVILGFVCTRYYQGEPCQFAYEHPNKADMQSFLDLDTKTKEALIEQIRKEAAGFMLSSEADEKLKEKKKQYEGFLKDIQDFMMVVSAIAQVLEKTAPGIERWLEDAQAPFGAEGELITGRKGAHRIAPKDRATELTVSKAKMLKNALKKKAQVYQGRGAYTGMVDNPRAFDSNLYPTMRVMPDNKIRPWKGMGTLANWGLISAAPKGEPHKYYNLEEDPSVGMGQLPPGNDHSQVGYIHGMCTAIIQAESQGSWCTVYEMATGEKTTKMASCFPCATYMYATGYPPNAIHLGRGESWLPPQAGDRLELDKSGASKKVPCTACLCTEKSAQWHRDIHHYLSLGLLAIEAAKADISQVHYAYVDDLKARLERDQCHISTVGGALFLDALTMHGKEEDRVKNTLNPLVSTLMFMADRKLGSVY